VTEEYIFDAQTGLLTKQKATNGSGTFIHLDYDYARNNAVGSLSGKTGHLTKITDNNDSGRNREYEFDVLGRLVVAKGGPTGNLWTQTYTYDRWGNRENVAATGVSDDPGPTAIPVDGIPNLDYDDATNRITTTGYQYDVNGNMIRSLAEDGSTWVKYEYDAANRLNIIRKDDANQTQLERYQYDHTNARVQSHDPAADVYKSYLNAGGTTLAEFTETTINVPTWTKSYTYLGNRLLATLTPVGGAENTELNHPDKIGTKAITNQPSGMSYEQNHLPFGTALNAESTLQNSNRRFTSYDRSSLTGLDYAINRTYDNKFGRFTQVDPIGMKATELMLPQTLNLYIYCGNDPINNTDPDGQFFFAFLGWLIGGLIGLAIASKTVRRILYVAFQVVSAVLNNQWVQLGFFFLDFILPGISKVASGLAKILSGINKAYQAASNIMGLVQIGAMIVEGQWKQLGVVLGMAAALAPLTPIMAGIKKGAQDALFGGKFDELADLFRGAWQGFKNGWRHFVQGIKRKGWEALIPFYGNRCGPGYGDNAAPGSGINAYDSEACGWHDDKLEGIRSDPRNRSLITGRLNARGYRMKILADLGFLGRSIINGAGPHLANIAFGGRGSIGAGYKSISFPGFGVRIIYFSLKL
jgi:RHS repeat-associated protein